MATRLNAAEREAALRKLPAWRHDAGADALARDFKFKDFSEAFGFMARVALLAPDDSEAAWAGHQVRTVAEQSLAAARRIRWRFADTLGRDRDRGIKQEGATLDVLQGLDMPAVLVEVGFLDHPEEGPYLLSEVGQRAVATALAGAITDLRSREQRGRKEPMTTAPRPGQQLPQAQP